MQTAGAQREKTGFIRVANDKISGLLAQDGLHPIGSLKELGLYSMLSALLSIPYFECAPGGLQAFLMKHCTNRYHSLHGSWMRLSSSGMLKRVRMPVGLNRFSDYYELMHTPQTDSPTVSHLTWDAGRRYRSQRTGFTPPAEDFTMVSFAVLMDERLSLSAKGLYAVIARKLRLADSLPEEAEKICKDSLRRCCREGSSAFERSWKELKACRYLTLKREWSASLRKMRYVFSLEGGEPAIPPRSVPQPARWATQPAGSEPPARLHRTGSGETQKPSGFSSEELLSSTRERIGYDVLCAEYPKERVDLIVSLLREGIQAGRRSPERLRTLNGKPVSQREIAERFSSVGEEEVSFVLDTFASVGKEQKIRNTRGYLISCLYFSKENLEASLETFLIGQIRN